MKKEGHFSWNTSLMEIVNVEERVSKTTEKPYLVIKATMVFFGNTGLRGGKKQSPKVYTMMCFSETLFTLFEAGNQHTFEGELSFDWGNTWLKITKLYDDEGNRLLRPTKGENDNTADEKIADSAGESLEAYFQKRIEENRKKNKGCPWDYPCDECSDQDCEFTVPY